MNGQVQLLIFQLDARRYGLPLAQVKRAVRAVDVTPIPGTPVNVMGVMDFQGAILPVLNIRQRFGLAGREIGLDDWFIIAETARRTVVLVVDRAGDVIERWVNDIVGADRVVDEATPIAGVIQLEDGLLLIHDLDRFLSADQERELEHSLAGQSSHGD